QPFWKRVFQRDRGSDGTSASPPCCSAAATAEACCKAFVEMHREPSSFDRASKSIAGDEKNNNVPSEYPALPPTTLEAAMNSPFLAFPTKLSLMMK
ncbi:unnamed protein product, partial [Ectocarpus sp. 8 AP-2014]